MGRSIKPHLKEGLACQAQYEFPHGSAELRIPRARIERSDGTTEEWRSEMLPRYQRRTRTVDEAILRTYLAGANSRRIRKALAPLLGESSTLLNEKAPSSCSKYY